MSKLQTSASSTWKPVTRPVPNKEGAGLSLMNGPPAIAPKPRPEIAPKQDVVTKPDGSKVWAYLYSVPAPQSAPPNGPKMQYPRSKECVGDNKPKLRRVQTYVPVDQKPNYNSRGGKMFQKQKKRMNDYVLTSTPNYQKNPHGHYEDNTPMENSHGTQPRDYSRHTPVGSKNMPAFVNNTINVKSNRIMKGPVIRPLRSPPPEWKAKVDAGYSYTNLPKYRSRKWDQQEEYYPVAVGYESAPEDLNYEDAEFTPHYASDVEAGGSLRGYRTDSRGEGPTTAAFYFNAKYHNKPHYLRQPYVRRDAFVTTPYVENDFNVKAVGWSRAYADRY